MRKISLLTLLSIASTLAYAQIQLPKVLQLPIEQALNNSREIKNKRIDLEKSDLQRQSVSNKRLPTVGVTAGYAYFDNRLTVDLPGYKLPVTGAELFEGKTKVHNHANVAHAGLLAKGVLFSGGQIQNGVKALEQKATGDSLMIETDKDNLIVDVVSSFDKLKFIRASEELVEDSDKRLQKEEERVNKAIANGLAVPFDRDKIKLARLELESKKTQLEENKDLLFQKLNYLTGMSLQELESISYSLDPILLPDSVDAGNKQELQALEAYINASEFALKKEKGTYLPQAAAFAGLSYSSLFNGRSSFNIPNLPPQIPQPDLKLNQFTAAPSWIAGVVLKWEIFSGNERRHKVHEAELNVQQLQNKLDDSRDKLNLLLRQKMASYHTQWKQIDLATQREVVAKNNLTLSAKQYEQGLISISQRLEAENDFVKAAQNKTEVLTNQRQSALEAMMVTGRLSEKIYYQ